MNSIMEITIRSTINEWLKSEVSDEFDYDWILENEQYVDYLVSEIMNNIHLVIENLRKIKLRCPFHSSKNVY